MLRLGSLFSGAAGLDRAVENVFGARTVWHCELDPAASKVLAHHYPNTPNLGDITQVNWGAVEPVDILCGGFPCQDVSSAGRRAGLKDGTRSGLWNIFADTIEQLRPHLVVIENVRGLLNAAAHRPMESNTDGVGDRDSQPVLRAIGAVLGDLSDLGYDAQWVTVPASAVGAPHRRERVFILAYDASGVGLSSSSGRQGRGASDEQRQASVVNRSGEAAADNTGSAGGDQELHDLCSGGGERDVQPRERFSDDPARRGDAPDTSSYGRDERRPESARFARGLDAAVSGDGPVELLPTPQTADGMGGHLNRSGARSTELLLPGVARAYGNGELLPTPNAQDGNGGGRYSSDWHQKTLPGEARLLPTPCARDFKDATASPGAVARNTPSLGAIEHYLPTPKASDGQRQDCPSERERNTPSLVSVGHYLPTPAASDATGGGSNPTRREQANHHVQLIDEVLGDSQRWGKYGTAIQRWEQVTRPAPAPTEPNTKGNPRLSAQFSEWLMGWPDGWVTAVPGVSRSDALRIIGNGVVSLQAEMALRHLLSFCEVVA